MGKVDPCSHCGEFHVLPYGGEVYCQSKHHFAHGFGWCMPLPPMSDEEHAELKAEIIENKNDSYPGGFAQWCADRGIPESKR